MLKSLHSFSFQLALKRDRSLANAPTEGYCYICETPKWGNSHHMGVTANRVSLSFHFVFDVDSTCQGTKCFLITDGVCQLVFDVGKIGLPLTFFTLILWVFTVAICQEPSFFSGTGYFLSSMYKWILNFLG